MGTGHGGEEVGVFVVVEMGDGDAGALELLHLGHGFAFDIVFADGAAQESLKEVDERGAKVLAVGADEGGDASGGRDGGSVSEDDVTAYAQSWIRLGDGDGVLEGGAGGHQGGGGEGFGLVKLRDSAIDARSEAEVVGVDDESRSHSVGLDLPGAAWPLPLFSGSLTWGLSCWEGCGRRQSRIGFFRLHEFWVMWNLSQGIDVSFQGIKFFGFSAKKSNDVRSRFSSAVLTGKKRKSLA